MNRKPLIGVAAGVATLLTSAAASAGDVHHPDCPGIVKDLDHTTDTPIDGIVWIKAGPDHYDVGYHDAGWDVPDSWAGHDTSHYDVCPTTQTTTTEATTSTSTIPPTSAPTTTEASTTSTTVPVSTSTAPTTSTSTVPATTSTVTTATTTFLPSTEPSTTSSGSATTSTAPAPTSSVPSAPSTTLPVESSTTLGEHQPTTLPPSQPTTTVNSGDCSSTGTDQGTLTRSGFCAPPSLPATGAGDGQLIGAAIAVALVGFGGIALATGRRLR